jgi:hypothetical protein
MNSIGDILLKETRAQQEVFLTNQVFYDYLDKHPELFALVSAARRSKNLTIAMVNVHTPEILQRTKKRDVEALVELQQSVVEFAQWLVTAGKRFGFPIFRGADIDEDPGVTMTKTQQGSKRRTVIHPDEKRPIISKAFNRFMRKVGGTPQAASKELDRLYGLLPSQAQVAEVIFELYRVRISPSTICRWLEVLKVDPVNKLKSFSNVRPRQNLGIADESLREEKKLSLLEFIAGQRARKHNFTQIAKSVKEITHVNVEAYSLTRIAIKYGIE